MKFLAKIAMLFATYAIIARLTTGMLLAMHGLEWLNFLWIIVIAMGIPFIIFMANMD